MSQNKTKDSGLENIINKIENGEKIDKEEISELKGKIDRGPDISTGELLPEGLDITSMTRISAMRLIGASECDLFTLQNRLEKLNKEYMLFPPFLIEDFIPIYNNALAPKILSELTDEKYQYIKNVQVATISGLIYFKNIFGNDPHKLHYVRNAMEILARTHTSRVYALYKLWDHSIKDILTGDDFDKFKIIVEGLLSTRDQIIGPEIMFGETADGIKRINPPKSLVDEIVKRVLTHLSRT